MQDQDQRLGDGSDNLANAAKQAGNAAKQISKQAAQKTAAKGAEAAAGAAAATVKAGIEGGKALSEIAAGTAAGGPWGAIISALWASRHTLFKVLVFLGLLLLLVIVMLTSLPSIVTNGIFGTDGVQPSEEATLSGSYTEMESTVSAAVQSGYEYAKNHVEELITAGGYDYDLSMEALIDNADGTTGYDTCYVLAAYSASLEQRGTSKEDMAAKLLSVSDRMFPVVSEEQTIEELVPVSYTVYYPVTVTVVTAQYLNGIVNGIPRFTYDTAERTIYLPSGEEESSVPITVPVYTSSVYTVPIYSGGAIIGTRQETYYDYAGTETLTPETNIIRFLQCTIQPFNCTVIQDAFGFDPSAPYGSFGITCGEAISKMTIALKMTLYGTLGEGEAVPLTDAQMVAFLNKQQCSPIRKQILATALSLVGKVPYFWGGKSAPGWNDAWNTPRLVTAGGSSTTGTIRPYGLDCSGFSDWTYKTALGVSLHADGNGQLENSVPITAAELRPGDLGFLRTGTTTGWSHVMIFAGYGDNGELMWVHATPDWVVLNSPSYPFGTGAGQLDLRRPTVASLD